MVNKTKVVDVGSSNVFKDLGWADADERKLKVQLAMRVNELIEGKGYTQAQVAELFGLAQPHVSELRNYRLNRFSSERLMYFMTLLDRDVQIVIKPKAVRRKTGSVSVLVTA